MSGAVGFDLAAIRSALAAAPLVSPYPFDLAIAIVDDTFRMIDDASEPPPATTWRTWARRSKLLEDQTGMLAHILVSTPLREATLKALHSRPRDATELLRGFFDAVAPLTAEMVRANAFRQEEFLRHWIAATGGGIVGESDAQSRNRLATLDYRQTLRDFATAEAARKQEAAKRRQALEAAAAAQAAARGWSE